MKGKRIAVLALLWLLAVFTGCAGDAPKNNLDVVQAAFDTLSAPEMRGRRVGTVENAAAGEYIAGVFSYLGLEPLLGDSFACPYEQEVFDAEKADPRLTAHLADGSSRELTLGSEFTFLLRHAPVDLTLSIAYDPNDAALAEKIYVDKTMSGLQPSTGAAFDIVPTEPGFVDAQGTVKGTRRDVMIEKGVLEELLGAGLNAFSVSCRDTKMPSTQNNYIGVLKGRDSSRAAIIGAHFDGAGADGDIYSAGAIDNASGVATMLGVASLLNTGGKPPVDVVFCAFNGEEGSKRWGSAAVAGDLASLYEERYYINVDCVGLAGDETYQYRASGDRALEEAFAAALQAAGYAVSDETIGGDWTPFAEADVPAVSLAQETLGIRHTTADRPEAIDLKALEDLAVFLAGFVRSGGDSVYSKEYHQDDGAQAAEKKAVAERRQLVDELGLGFHDSYMYKLDRYYVCISGNRPVSTAAELKVVYPWVEVREELGPYKMREVLGIDGQTNKPFEISDMKTERRLGSDSATETMPLDEVVSTVPGSVDSYHFVYEDSEGRCVQICVYRIYTEWWALLSRNCVPLVPPGGEELPKTYYLPRGDSEDAELVRYYTGGDFIVDLCEFDTSRPADDPNGYPVYTCDVKPLSLQEAVDLVEDLGLTELDDYFTSLLRDPGNR